MRMEMVMKDESLGSKKNNLFLSFLFSKNQKGQFAIEAVLLMTVLLGAFLALTKAMNDNKILQKFVSAPMERVGLMAGYGTWQKECVGQGKSKKLSLGKCHPNSIQRSLSSNPN